jgi:hypothetical protein
MSNGAKPKTIKPTGAIKIVPLILVITFFVCTVLRKVVIKEVEIVQFEDK